MNRELIRDHMVVADGMMNMAGVSNVQHKITRGELFQKVPDGKGNLVLKKIASNTVVLGGAIMALERLTGASAAFKPTTLNDLLGVPCASVNPGTEKIALFGCGTGGAQLDWGNIVAPDIKQNNVIDMVPLRYGSVLSGDDASKYFMKKLNADGTTYSWYLKEFDAAPVIKSCWKNAVDSTADGTEILADIADSGRTDGIETFAQFELTLNTHDLHEYFAAVGNLGMARYNTFGFYTGEYNSATGEYANVRLYAVVTFNNRDVSMESSSSFVYRVYSLV